MTLLLRITTVDSLSDPEDFLNESLGTIFPDEVMNHHGDASNALRYTSPHLPQPLLIRLADPSSEEDRRLFGHYLWNASLMLAEFIEAGTLGLKLDPPLLGGGQRTTTKTTTKTSDDDEGRSRESLFDVTGLSTIELGSGTALPSIMSALVGASEVTATDYPSPTLMELLRTNVAHNTQQEAFIPSEAGSKKKKKKKKVELRVEGHEWGNFDCSSSSPDNKFPLEKKNSYDRVLVCDCLWMPWQHDNLRKSIAWFMKEGGDSRAWVVAGFHTGRERMVGFLRGEKLAEVGLEVEEVWERDVEGKERGWEEVREDDGDVKRWLVVAVLRRRGVEG